MVEVSVTGPSSENPFVDVRFGARFTLGHGNVDVTGFYDGSGPRITFLRKLLESPGTTGLIAVIDSYYTNAGNPGERILYYFDYHCVAEYDFPLPEKITFKATMIDPWAMTKTPLPGTFSGKPYMAVLFEKA